MCLYVDPCSGPATACSPISSNLDSTLTSCSRLCSSRHINLHCFMSFYPRALSFFPHFRHSGLLLSPMSVSVFFLPTIYGFSSFYRHRLTFWLVSFFSTMAYSMAHLAAGSLCLLEPSGHARAGSGVTTSVSALGIGSWVSIRTTYPERRGHGRPPPLPPPRPPFAYCQSSFFFLLFN